MKTLVNLGLGLLFLVASISAGAQENTNRYNKTYNAKAGTVLSIRNKFGKVHVTTGTGDKIVINATVEVIPKKEGKPDKALEMLNDVEVSFSESGNQITAETIFHSQKINNKADVNIEYQVTMPKSVNFETRSQFTDVYVGDIDGWVKLKLQYGNITLGALNHPENEVNLQFAKGEIRKMTGGELTLRYSQVEMDAADKLEVDGQFSELELDEVNMLEMESRYDKLELGVVKVLELESQFSNIEVEELHTSIELENRYGGVEIEKVHTGFEAIEIENSFAGIDISFAEPVGFELEAEMEFCSLRYPGGWSIKESRPSMHSSEYEGNAGSGDSAVSIESSYGEVKLKED